MEQVIKHLYFKSPDYFQLEENAEKKDLGMNAWMEWIFTNHLYICPLAKSIPRPVDLFLIGHVILQHVVSFFSCVSHDVILFPNTLLLTILQCSTNVNLC